jgi:hypothetical protein
MEIRKVNRWRVNGLDFETEDKARDYLESMINSIIANRGALASILSALNDGTEEDSE